MPNILDLLRNKTIQTAEAARDANVGTTVSEVVEEQEAAEIVAEAQQLQESGIPLDSLYSQQCKPTAENIRKIYGNKVELIHNEIYTPLAYKTFYKNKDFNEPFQYSDEIADNLRFAAQKYWVQEQNQNFNFARPQTLLPSSQVPFEIRIREATYSENSVIPLIEQKIHLLPKESEFTRPDSNEFLRARWDKYVNGGNLYLFDYERLVELDKPFTDHVFDHYKPIDEEMPGLAKKAEISVNYNFYVKDFESVSKQKNLPEIIMPNVYAMVAQLENSAGNERVAELNNLGGLLDDILVEQNNGSAITFRDNAQYFDQWSREINNTPQVYRDKMKRWFSDIIFQAEELEQGLLDLAQDRENIYPFSIQIDFTTDSTTEFSEILKSSNLGKTFTKTLIRDFISKRVGLDNSVEETEFAVCKCYNELPIENSKIIQTWDVTKWWLDFERQLVNIPTVDNSTPIAVNSGINQPTVGEQATAATNQAAQAAEASAAVAAGQAVPFSVLAPFTADDYATFIDAFPDLPPDNLDPFYGQILRLIFAGKLRKFIKKHVRDYCAMVSGEDAYAEPILYRISKHAVLPSGVLLEEPIQNFYLPNTNEIDTISFVDTQVKYGKDYVYKIWSYYLTVGNEYYYTNFNSSEKKPQDFIKLDNNNVVTFKVVNTPRIIVAEVEEKTFEPIRLMDDPPPPPVVDWIPYLGDDRKIAVSVCAGGGEYRTEPIQITAQDEKTFFNILRKQQSKDGRIRFAGDDVVQNFEIYRINQHPESYRDFENFKIATLSTLMPSNSLQRSSEVTFVDNLIPNRKYYYTFRSLDVHNNISNPSPIFEIELVNNSGAIYPLIRTVELLKKDSDNVVKKFKKYLRINVAQPQKEINLEKSKLPRISKSGAKKGKTFIFLGENSRDSVWNRKFKVRITSASSGKKIDINFRFNKQTNEYTATDVQLDDVIVENPNSIAQILETLLNNK